MTDPEQVSVNVADLRMIFDAFPCPEYYTARARLQEAVAIPEPEWEPTDDMRAKYRRSRDRAVTEAEVDYHLRALHREGLL